MENVLIALAAFALGVYNAEKVRDVVPVLNPNDNVGGA